jgi:hypothetical protein
METLIGGHLMIVLGSSVVLVKSAVLNVENFCKLNNWLDTPYEGI